ncbi:hypothetical protein [Arthrobacter caoxuetaonis]|uniref:Uncharacterized protein n=1 Tax=Arthrobacter caoxuetaonis TaxID=2886935 RepID=A0A9X1SDP1_9MICC|nr:hypothetical protein [Arthrobacter caoxuetaonis]MCC3299383.1 hypothetical protein [Arthrobacter caoxuetaonis]USQ59124.1 hypothetical protein NF551_18635 [Arthrobacter caoxuetaonis]
MHLGPLAVTAMALLYGAESWVPAAIAVAAYSFIAFIPMMLDAVSADIAGSEPDRTTEERRATGATGLAGIAAIILTFRLDSPVVTLGLCLLFTVATLAVVVTRGMGANRRGVISDDVPVTAAAPGDHRPGAGLPGPVSASAHHGLTRAGWQ